MKSKNRIKLSAAVQEQIHQDVQNLMSELQGVVAVVMATVDGFSVASVTHSQLDASRVAALASSISAIGQVASSEAKLGLCRSITIDTNAGFVSMYAIKLKTADLVLTVITNPDALMAQVNYRAYTVIKRLEKVE